MGRHGRTHSPRLHTVLPLLVVAVACLVRCIGLADRPFWLDEAYSALYARIDLGTFIELRRHSTNPPLYHILLGLWASLFGYGEAALRFPSAIAGTAAVACCLLLGRSIAGLRAGLIAAGLLAINSFAVGYAQEARYYAMNQLLAIAATMLLRSVAGPRGRWATAGYAATMTVFVWMHTFAWFILAGHALAVLYHWGRPGSGTALANRVLLCFGIATTVVVLSFSPWVGVLASQVATVLSRGYWIPRPRWYAPFVCLHDYTVPLESLRWLLVIACGLGVAWHVFCRPSRSHPAAVTKRVTQFDMSLLLCWAVVPVAIPLIWSLVATPIFLPKYALPVQPALLLLLAVLIIRRPLPGYIVLACLAAAHAPAANRGLVYEDWRSAARIIEQQALPNQPVYICQDYTYFALTYYLDDTKYRIIPVLHQDARPSEFWDIFPMPALRYRAWLEQLADRRDPCWVVLSRVDGGRQGPTSDQIRKTLQSFAKVEHFPIDGDVDVMHVAPDAALHDGAHTNQQPDWETNDRGG